MKEINMSDKSDELKVNETEEKEVTEPQSTPLEEEKVKNKKKPKKEKEPKGSLEKKIEVKKGSVSKKKGIIILSAIGLVFLLGIAAFYYFGIYKYNPKAKDNNVVEVINNYIPAKSYKNVLAHLLVDQPKEPRTEVSPINGLLFTKSEMEELMSRRPVAVMINNHAQSRPQSGLSSADIVYEALAEGGITRFLAFYWSQGPQKVGSIRSARQYYLEWLSPYDPLYIHIGWADTNDPRTDARDNIIAYNIKVVGLIGSWVWDDGVRHAPHDKYHSVVSAWDYGESRGWDGFPSKFEAWKFKNDADSDERGDGYRYKVVFHNQYNNGGLYDVIWQYEPTTNSYKRWVGGKPHIDQETNTQLTSKVVIVQENVMTPTYDDKGRIIIETIGQGDAVILMDGKEINGRWKKTNRTDRTTYYDDKGEEIEFNRGRIWISSIPTNVGEFDIIEQ
jgi:hypothetical protein